MELMSHFYQPECVIRYQFDEDIEKNKTAFARFVAQLEIWGGKRQRGLIEILYAFGCFDSCIWF